LPLRAAKPETNTNLVNDQENTAQAEHLLSREGALAAQQLDPEKLFTESQIKEKTSAGLSREQALEVLKSQQANDEKLEGEQSPINRARKHALETN
jgi:hypothetical protein